MTAAATTVPGTLITVAPTGTDHAKSDVPNLPVTLAELVRTAQDCARVGASVIHVHARGADGKPTLDLGLLRETVAGLRENTPLIVRLSTAGVPTDSEADRLRVLDALPDSASCVFAGRWEFTVELHKLMAEREIVPEYEIHDLGQLTSLRRLLDDYGLPACGRVHVGLMHGASGGMPGTVETVSAALRELPEGATFSATGIDQASIPVMLTTLAACGHLRVGMADTISYGNGEPARDNAQLVARAAGLARIAQRPPLPGEAARELLGVPPAVRHDG